MKFCVLRGSPRLHANTAELCKPFIEELKASGAEITYITLADKNIYPCKGCYACQNVNDEYGCVQKDDMYGIVDAIYASDCIVLATPIYSWYCPSEMKAVLDRHYGVNKQYGSASESLWAGNNIALLLTHGYDEEYATTPFVNGIKCLCNHSKLHYRGMYSVRDVDDLASFQTIEAVAGARDFAKKLLET